MSSDEPALLGGSDPVPDPDDSSKTRRPTPVLSSRVAPAPPHGDDAIALTRGAPVGVRRHSTGSLGSPTSGRRESFAGNLAYAVRRHSSLVAGTINALPLAFGAGSSSDGTSADADSDEEGGGAAGMFAKHTNAMLRGSVDEGVIDAETIESRLTECRLAAGGNAEEKVILDALIEQILPKFFSRYVALEQNQLIAKVRCLLNDSIRPLRELSSSHLM